MRRRLAAAVGALTLTLALTACSSSEPTSTKPTFGGDAGTTIAPDDLAAAKAAAGIEDCPVADGQPATDDALPDLTLDCLGGGAPVELARLTGAPMVINVWASWCRPCRKELPIMARADAAFGDAVRFIGIDYFDGDPDRAIALAQASGVTYPQLSDPDQAIKSPLKVVALPQTIFVDAQGRMVATERKEFRSYADLTAAIERHLGVTP